MMKLQEEILKIKNEMIDEFDKRVEALKVEEQEFPQDGDEYWYMGVTGEIFISEWNGYDSEESMLKIGNIFRTEEEAQFAAEKLRVEAELRKFSRPFKENENSNWFILWNTYEKEVEIDWAALLVRQGTIYFESKEKVQQAIESVGEERIKKYIFGVEELNGY